MAKNEKLILHQDSCKACLYCVAACPKQALAVSDYTNAKGYQAVGVDEEKCVVCGACFAVCPDYVYEIVKGDAV